MNRAAVGFAIALIGPSVWLLPGLLIPSWNYYLTEQNHILAIALFAASLVISISAGYFFCRHWGRTGIVPGALISTVIFYLFETEVTNLEGGYHGSGGGAEFMFLIVPGIIFLFSLVSGALGAARGPLKK